jgi:cysteinyl-tRNA synthetase
LIPINEFLGDYSGDVMRLIVLSSHYRSPLTFNNEVIEANQRALERLLSAKRPALPGTAGAPPEIIDKLDQQAQTTRQGFDDAMNEDFNTAGALGYIFDLVRIINQTRAENGTNEELAAAQEVFNELTGVLGLTLDEPKVATTSADGFIDLILALRQELRQKKLYDLADQVRDSLANLGVVIEDTPQGSTWRWE